MMANKEKTAIDDAFAADVRAGLTATPKTLPPVWFYDARGSELFDAITEQPEYYLTATEKAILAEHATAILAAAGQGATVTLAELGAGSATKTRVLIRALLAMQGEVEYTPIDVSGEAVEAAAKALSSEFNGLIVRPIVGRNREAILDLDADDPRTRLILFIGSSLGNFEPADAARFLSDVVHVMRPQDRLLLGLDMMKEPSILAHAYDDDKGVTAAFNLNVLARMNRELAADFDLDSFRHRAVVNEDEGRVEMHLVSTKDQNVHIGVLGLDVAFAAEESIHTENSYKYSPRSLARVLDKAGLENQESWYDAKEWFGLHLLRKADR